MERCRFEVSDEPGAGPAAAVSIRGLHSLPSLERMLAALLPESTLLRSFEVWMFNGSALSTAAVAGCSALADCTRLELRRDWADTRQGVLDARGLRALLRQMPELQRCMVYVAEAQLPGDDDLASADFLAAAPTSLTHLNLWHVPTIDLPACACLPGAPPAAWGAGRAAWQLPWTPAPLQP